jgi:hypothetical protein
MINFLRPVHERKSHFLRSQNGADINCSQHENYSDELRPIAIETTGNRRFFSFLHLFHLLTPFISIYFSTLLNIGAADALRQMAQRSKETKERNKERQQKKKEKIERK